MARPALRLLRRPGVPIPDVSPRPTAWCGACDEVVAAVQSWRRPNQRKVGKYRQQYDYRCPNARCRYSLVEPFVLPAASIIDWTDLGSRIGDREANGKRPLVAATMRRIQSGLDMFAEPTMLNVNHGIGEDGRPYPAAASPVPARTTKTGDGLACPPMLVPAGGGWNEIASSLENPMRTRTTRDIEGVCTPAALPEPFITMLRNHAEATGINEPLATLATARHHGVTVPPHAAVAGAFISKHHGGLDYAAIEHMNKTVGDPLPGLVAKPNMSLVIPYRKGRVTTTEDPIHTQATIESAGLATPAIDINDCHFRMVKPRESARAQRFPDNYRLTGNQGEQQLQAGNAVSSNVSQWLGAITVQVLS